MIKSIDANAVDSKAIAKQLLASVGAKAKLTIDSRQVRPGDVFFAVPGGKVDGRGYIDQALAAGASVVLAETADQENVLKSWSDSRVVAIRGLRRAMGDIANEFYGEPSGKLISAAITGTNGKTSVSQWLAQSLCRLDTACGVIGTLGVGRPDGPLRNFSMTTPDSVALHTMLAGFVEDGFKAVVFEASSIGIAERRLDGVSVDIAAFTNLSQDHLDYHGDMAAYAQAKAALFSRPELKAAVINLDDPYAQLMLDACRHGVSVYGYSVAANRLTTYPFTALLSAQTSLQQSTSSSTTQVIDLVIERRACAATKIERSVVELALMGDFNVSNALAVAACLLACEQLGRIGDAKVGDCLSALRAVPGRMEPVLLKALPMPDGSVRKAPTVLVDYAHTPDALDKSLRALRPNALRRGGQLWVVFGAGGDRDASKRPLMGQVCANLADRVVVTSDNPRSESAQKIIDAIVIDLGEHRAKCQIEVDRRRAIAYALRSAKPIDIILLAGKGHETYQEIAGVQHPFDDRLVAQEEWLVA